MIQKVSLSPCLPFVVRGRCIADCRFAQALEHVNQCQRARIISELRNHILTCILSANANHVIQRVVAFCSSLEDDEAVATIESIIETFRGRSKFILLLTVFTAHTSDA